MHEHSSILLFIVSQLILTHMEKKFYPTNYDVAVHWLNNDYILCNKIAEDYSIYDNARFSFENENGDPIEIFQWYLTDCDESQVEWLEEHFGLKFTYADSLELFVLAVDHYGTAWDYVYWTCDFENAKAELGQTK